jgi:6-pyruvoyltetrahydropterin/6-carboxytetrahydropterin synthase
LSDEENALIFGKCNNPNGHGHNYKVTVTLRGPIDARTGMLINLTALADVLKPILAAVDHKHLDLDVAYFRDNDVVSTAENIAVFFWRAISRASPKLVAPVLHSIRIDETDKNSCTFLGETNDDVNETKLF